MHIIAFGLLGFFTARALYNQDRFPQWRKYALWLAFFLATTYGILDEYHQSFVPGRTVDVWDAVADAIGAFLGAALFHRRSRLDRPNAA